MHGVCRNLVLLALFGLGTHPIEAQSLAESAKLTSQTVAVANSAKLSSSTAANAPKQDATKYIMEPAGPPPDEKNRHDFEDNAGEEAGKLLFRSEPSGADIFINDLLVGRTPLLMIIAPGKYKIDMRGPRQESQHTTVGVMAKETQTIVLKLSQRYPASVTIR